MHSELVDDYVHHMPAGDVTIEFTIDALGYVSDPTIVKSAHSRLDPATLKSAALWRFVPPPKACRHQMTITYRIEDGEGA
jgi:TonB family protein